MIVNTNSNFKKSFGYNCLYEVVNKDELEFILKNWKLFEKELDSSDWDIDYKPKVILTKYLNAYKKNKGYMSIKYKKTDKYDTKIGRYFCMNSIGIQSMPRKIRHTICKGLYIDLDFKNCHPVILKQLCEKYKIPCNYLSIYVNNRNEILMKISNAINVSINDAKFIFLKALNGNKTNYEIENWGYILYELNEIHTTIANMDEFKELKEEVMAESKENVNARVVNRILCSIENDCLECLFQTLDKNKCFDYYSTDFDKVLKVGALIFDGLQVLDNKENRELLTGDFLISLSHTIKVQTGYSLELVIKDFDECLKLPSDFKSLLKDEGDNIIKNDIEACAYVVNKFGYKYIKCNNLRYVKFGDIWTCNQDVVEGVIIQDIIKADLYIESGEKIKSYSGFKCHINSCYKLVYMTGFTIDNDFIRTNMNKNKYYLPFKDCVYSFKDNTTYDYNELDIQFTQQINKNFPNFIQEDYDELLTRVINPIYPDEEERNYNAHIKSRALAGCYKDKKWYASIGSRNSGKSVETSLLKNAFECFVKSFDAKCLISNKYGNQTQETALAWVVDKREARIIISNEINGDEKTILNGAFIKTLASGGDEMEGRKLYENLVSFIPQFTMFLCCNELYEIKPADAMENLEQIEYKSKFVPKDELIAGSNFYKLKDDNIKDLIQEERIINAYIWYILKGFSMEREPMPLRVKIATENGRGDEKETLEVFITNNFKTTDNIDDKLFTSDIQDILKTNGYEVSLVETGRQINKQSIGRHNSKCNINKERKAGYEYIKFTGV